MLMLIPKRYITFPIFVNLKKKITKNLCRLQTQVEVSLMEQLKSLTMQV